MHAVILAGGKGRRLEPYTVSFPKPLVPVGDMPILEIVIRQLKAAGFDRVTLAVGHLAELLMAYFGDGSKWGLTIEYSREEKPLGTVGPLKLIDDLPEHFLVMNGDVLTTLRYDALFDQHRRSHADLTIACYRANTKIDLGVIEFDGRMEVTGYREKPVLPYDVSMGVYMFNRSVLETFGLDQYMDLPTIVNQLIRDQGTVKVYLSDHEWLDIGRPTDYAQAQQRFEELRHEFLPGEYASPHEAPAATRAFH
ncbi:MAG: sugar phosphate nucleotidyltransferase [Planctomycetota bacterium]